jgi:hypothetical protein
MNFAAIFEDNYSRVNAIGFAIACQENWHHVRRLIPHGILKDAVHNGYPGPVPVLHVALSFYFY